jgi:hypothetical protein
VRTPTSNRIVLAATALIALLISATLLTQAAAKRFAIRADKLPSTVAGVFQRNGQHPEAIEPLGVPRPRLWASWVGNDQHTGSLSLGPFEAGRKLAFFTCGYPSEAGIRLYLRREFDAQTLDLKVATGGQQWILQTLNLPQDWHGVRVTLHAEDNATEFRGWVGISEPIPVFFGTDVAMYLATGLLVVFSVAPHFLLILAWLRKTDSIDPNWQLMAAFAGVAALGYALFWIVFFSPQIGRLVVFGGWLFSAWRWWSLRGERSLPTQTHKSALFLMLLVGTAMLAVLCWHWRGATYEVLTQNRFLPALPSDNNIPGIFARMMLDGGQTVHIGTDWLTSDRPPLQSAFLLLVLPWSNLVGLSSDMAEGIGGLVFQLLWVPACLALLSEFGLGERRARLLVVSMAATGFVLLNTVFVWPKLAAAAFALSVFGSSILNSRRNERASLFLGSLFLVLAWLCHGGVAFSLLALAPWVLWRLRRHSLGTWAVAALLVFSLWAPWLAFQKLHAPPANRLLKWHLAGQIDIDPRPFGQTLLEAYRGRSLQDHIGHRRVNFETLAGEHWDTFLKPTGVPTKKRHPEFFYTLRALGFWLIGLPFLAWSLWRGPLSNARRQVGQLGTWTLLTLVIWCLLMFQGGTAIIHQGSYAATLGLFLLCGLGVVSLPRRGASLIFLAFSSYFAWVWWAPSLGEEIPMNPLAALLLIPAILGSLALVTSASEETLPQKRGA